MPVVDDLLGMMNAIPKDLQLPLVVVVGLIGFFVVIGMSGLSAKKAPVATPVKAKKKRTPSKSKKSPKSPRSSRKTSTPINKKTGSVQTPAGRRSARLAKRRKED